MGWSWRYVGGKKRNNTLEISLINFLCFKNIFSLTFYRTGHENE